MKSVHDAVMMAALPVTVAFNKHLQLGLGFRAQSRPAVFEKINELIKKVRLVCFNVMNQAVGKLFPINFLIGRPQIA